MDDALRRRLDALVGLLGLAVALLAALVGTQNIAALVGATLVWIAALLVVFVLRPSYGSSAAGTGSD